MISLAWFHRFARFSRSSLAVAKDIAFTPLLAPAHKKARGLDYHLAAPRPDGDVFAALRPGTRRPMVQPVPRRCNRRKPRLPVSEGGPQLPMTYQSPDLLRVRNAQRLLGLHKCRPPLMQQCLPA